MDKTFIIDGMHCGGCVTRITKSLSGFADKVQVTLDPPHAVLRGVHSDASLEVMQIALAGAGKYTMVPALPVFGGNSYADIGAGANDGFFSTYKPLLLIMSFLVGVTWLVHAQTPNRQWHEWMLDFMAGFFLVFSFFKLLNLSGFVQAYRGYDLIAARSAAYAAVYPFIELALGAAYLVRWQPQITSGATLVLMLVSATGVWNALRNRQLVECASLGTMFKLPLSNLALIENLGIASMAALLFSQR